MTSVRLSVTIDHF